MANEIQVQVTLRCVKNGWTVNQSLSKTATMAGDESIQNVQQVGTSCEAITLGDVSTLGYVLVVNLDDTNFVELSSDNANANKFAKLLPGDITLVKASAAFYGKADTATCKVGVVAIEL